LSLSEEDSLRLHVLAKSAVAIRIDEARMIVFGLSERGEHRVELRPSGREERYLRLVRELLSTVALGTPGGYPVFIRRWTRSGALEAERLNKLLCLGEPEAVVAVAASSELTDSLAHKAWWCLPTSETARMMLRHHDVIEGQTGPLLVAFLLEQLPFETATRAIIDTIKVMLHSNLLDAQAHERLWTKATQHVAYLVGFLAAGPVYLEPTTTGSANLSKPRTNAAAMRQTVDPLAKTRSTRRYLKACAMALEKAIDMDVVVDTVNAIGVPFQTLRPASALPRSVDALKKAVTEQLAVLQHKPAADPQHHEFARLPQSHREAIAVLSLTGEPLVAPVFAHTDATGSLMRQKLASTLAPVIQALDTLTRDEGAAS
jgi:hypothetical protein